VKRGMCSIVEVCTVAEILNLKCIGSWSWPFRVAWRHRSRDHSTHTVRLTIGCPHWVRISNVFRVTTLTFHVIISHESLVTIPYVCGRFTVA